MHVARERCADDQRSQQSADTEQHMQVVERRRETFAIQLDDNRVGSDVDAAVGEAVQKIGAQQDSQARRECEPGQSRREQRHRTDQNLLRAQLLMDLAGDQHRDETASRAGADHQPRALDRNAKCPRDLRDKRPRPAAVDTHHQHARIRQPGDRSFAAQRIADRSSWGIHRAVSTCRFLIYARRGGPLHRARDFSERKLPRPLLQPPDGPRAQARIRARLHAPARSPRPKIRQDLHHSRQRARLQAAADGWSPPAARPHGLAMRARPATSSCGAAPLPNP